MKGIARVTGLVLLSIALVWMLWLFSSAVLLFIVSLIVASSVRPFATRLMERGLSKALSYALVFFGFLLFLGLLIGVSASSLATELQQAGDDILNFYTKIKVQWPEGAKWQQQIAETLPKREDVLNYIAGQDGTGLFKTIFGFGSGLFDALAQLIILFSLSTYWAIDRTRFERLWLSLISAKNRARARTIWHAIEDEAGAYVRSEVLQSVFAAILLGVAYKLLNVPYPTLLAIWAGLTWLIPWLGVILAVIPAFILGWQVSIPLAIIATVLTIIVFAVFELWVEPRLYGRNRVSSVLVVVMMMIMASYLGIFGLLVAPPLAAVIQILLRELVATPSGEAVEVTARQQLQLLRERLTELRTSQEARKADNLPQRLSLIKSLDDLITDTNALVRRDRTAAEQTVIATSDEPETAPLPS